MKKLTILIVASIGLTFIVAVENAQTRAEIIANHQCICTNRTTHNIDVCNPYSFLHIEPKVSLLGKIKMFLKGESCQK